MHNSETHNKTHNMYLSLQEDYCRFWGFDSSNNDNKTVQIIMSTYDTPVTDLGYRRSLTSVGDAVSSALVASNILAYYGNDYRLRITSSNDFHPDFWNGNIVLLGGRVRNIITNQYLDRVKKAWNLALDIDDFDSRKPRAVHDMVEEKYYHADIDKLDMKLDYGVITRTQNPFSDDCSVTLFYGLHTFGTIGAASAIQSEHISKIVSILDKIDSKWFQILVRVRVYNEHVYPEIIKYYPLKKKRKSEEDTREWSNRDNTEKEPAVMTTTIYNIYGQAGAVGNNATAIDPTFVFSPQSSDSELVQKLTVLAEQVDIKIAKEDIAALQSSDNSKKRVVLDKIYKLAIDVGASVLTSYISGWTQYLASLA